MVIIVPARPAALMSDGAFPMPYWSAKGTRLRYVTRAVVADDAQYDWTSPTLVVGNNRQTTAADIGAWQVVSDDGNVEFFTKGWPATPMTKLFPERQIYIPGAVPHPGVERVAASVSRAGRNLPQLLLDRFSDLSSFFLLFLPSLCLLVFPPAYEFVMD